MPVKTRSDIQSRYGFDSRQRIASSICWSGARHAFRLLSGKCRAACVFAMPGNARRRMPLRLRGGSYSSAKRDLSSRWAFSAALTQARPGLRPPPAALRPLAHGSGVQAQLCAAFRCRPARRGDSVGGPSGLGHAICHAPDGRHRSSSAACLWLQRARQVAGIGGALGAGTPAQGPSR